MPFINSKVSVTLTDNQKEVLKTELGKAISLIPGKSEEWLMLGFEDNYSLYFKGQAFEKIAYVEVKIFGSTTAEAYDKLTVAICDIFNNVVGVDKDKIYVKYEEVSHWGYNGFNF
ncbi:phenylpyruvate tautomerase MIF-related protein [Anaerosporobacter sp.]|uniref:phenylpyruvate tautomerase MIF-related protein n=1 Tax=Anaerosporobacter sp. TaxID=1872529 RepID=UPI00286FA3E8|nr:phenylpyruvate tautomerase MIF-related protein [Anaerosporobacter sp.]